MSLIPALAVKDAFDYQGRSFMHAPIDSSVTVRRLLLLVRELEVVF